jgi:HPt (histidine-containing phosphotransfer) domain-containing protein
MSVATLLDREVITTLAGMSEGEGTDFLATMITMYLESTPAVLASLRQSAAAGDLRAIQRASHDLKSSSATLGAGILASRCAKLEAMARSGVAEGVEAAVSDIIEGFSAVRPELEALLPT